MSTLEHYVHTEMGHPPHRQGVFGGRYASWLAARSAAPLPVPHLLLAVAPLRSACPNTKTFNHNEMNKETAEKLIELSDTTTKEYSILLDEIKATCTEAQFLTYRKGMAQILGHIYTNIMLPIFEEYPDLQPPDIDEN